MAMKDHFLLCYTSFIRFYKQTSNRWDVSPFWEGVTSIDSILLLFPFSSSNRLFQFLNLS